MSNAIRSIQLQRLRNEEHLEFHAEFVKLAGEYTLSETFSALLAIYQERYDELDAALEVIRKSVYTGQMRAADRQRKRTFRRLRFAVGEFGHDANPEKQLAGERLGNIIEHYGNLSRGPRAEKTAAMANMLEDLREKGAAD
ncbi:MAG: DUF6261 family protein, partial [Puniceicoccales bacterium]|nr:DUF6261 family protein [Puniceicoccales bacterium]